MNAGGPLRILDFGSRIQPLRIAAIAFCATFVSVCAAAPSWWVNRLTGGVAGAWWRHAAFGVSGLRILALLLGLIAAWSLTMMALTQVHSAARWRISPVRLRSLGRDVRGTAIIEFALLFPVALLLFLVIIQTAFLYTANFYVNLAAYRAARAAIVWSDLDKLPPDERHTLVIGPEARRRIENAAVFSCISISGTTVASAATGSAAAQDAVWQAFIGRPMGWSGERLQHRYEYARAHTRVRIETMTRPDPLLSDWNARGQEFYRGREPITVQVSHDFELAMPYAKWILGSADNQGVGRGFRYIELRASYTLVNEGQPELHPAAGVPGISAPPNISAPLSITEPPSISEPRP